MNTLRLRALSASHMLRTPGYLKALLILGGLLAMVMGSGADNVWVGK